MNNENERRIFANLQDLLASLSKKDRDEFLVYLKKNEIPGNEILEPLILAQFNAGLFVDAAMSKVSELLKETNLSVEAQKSYLEAARLDFESAVQTQTNLAIKAIQDEIGKTVEIANGQVGKVNTTMINLADNISRYIDTSIAKMLAQIADAKIETMNEMTTYYELAKTQWENELKALMIEMLRKEFPTQLKNSVKAPIADHLNKYLGIMDKKVGGMESKINSHDPWSIVGVIRDYVIFGAASATVLFLAKMFHFI